MRLENVFCNYKCWFFVGCMFELNVICFILLFVYILLGVVLIFDDIFMMVIFWLFFRKFLSRLFIGFVLLGCFIFVFFFLNIWFVVIKYMLLLYFMIKFKVLILLWVIILILLIKG